jgi:hypothetical protein
MKQLLLCLKSVLELLSVILNRAFDVPLHYPRSHYPFDLL